MKVTEIINELKALDIEENFDSKSSTNRELKKRLDDIERALKIIKGSFEGIKHAFDANEKEFDYDWVEDINIEKLVKNFNDTLYDIVAPLEMHIDEGMHYSTKIRQVEGSNGTRKARMAIREAKRLVENFLDTNHPSPNPASDDDKQLLLDSVEDLSSAIQKVSEAKVAKRIKN